MEIDLHIIHHLQKLTHKHAKQSHATTLQTHIRFYPLSTYLYPINQYDPVDPKITLSNSTKVTINHHLQQPFQSSPDDNGIKPKSIDDISPDFGRLPLSPRIATRMLLNRLKRRRVLMYCMITKYSPFFFRAMSWAILL